MNTIVDARGGTLRALLIEHYQGLVKRHLRLRSTFLGYSKLSKELARRFHLAEAKKKCKLAIRKCFAREEPLQHVARLLNHRGRLAQARQRMPHVVGLENLNARSILQFASGERQVRFMRGAFWNSFVDGLACSHLWLEHAEQLHAMEQKDLASSVIANLCAFFGGWGSCRRCCQAIIRHRSTRGAASRFTFCLRRGTLLNGALGTYPKSLNNAHRDGSFVSFRITTLTSPDRMQAGKNDIFQTSTVTEISLLPDQTRLNE